MKWFFHFDSKRRVVELRARAESDDGAVGDAFARLRRGQSFYGVSFAKLRKAEAGVLEVDDAGEGRIDQPDTKLNPSSRDKFVDEGIGLQIVNPDGKLRKIIGRE